MICKRNMARAGLKNHFRNLQAPLHISNVMLMADGKATRVGFKMDGDKKVRVAKATGKVID